MARTYIGSSFKIQGQTAADAAIATQVVKFTSEGEIEFTVGNQVYNLPQTPAVKALIKAIFTGVDGPGHAL